MILKEVSATFMGGFNDKDSSLFSSSEPSQFIGYALNRLPNEFAHFMSEMERLRTENAHQKIVLNCMSSDLSLKNQKIKELEAENEEYKNGETRREEEKSVSNDEFALVNREMERVRTENMRNQIVQNIMSSDLKIKNQKIKVLVAEVEQLRGKIEEMTKEAPETIVKENSASNDENREIELLRAQNSHHQRDLGKMSAALGLKNQKIKELESEVRQLRGRNEENKGSHSGRRRGEKESASKDKFSKLSKVGEKKKSVAASLSPPKPEVLPSILDPSPPLQYSPLQRQTPLDVDTVTKENIDSDPVLSLIDKSEELPVVDGFNPDHGDQNQNYHNMNHRSGDAQENGKSGDKTDQMGFHSMQNTGNSTLSASGREGGETITCDDCGSNAHSTHECPECQRLPPIDHRTNLP